MNKTQQIKEIAKVIGDTWLVDLEGETKGVCEVLDEVDIEGIARELYEQDYRKADEVRKETAEKIFAQIEKDLSECTIVNEGDYGWNYQGYEATDLRKRLTKLAKQFGVEVE